MTCNRPIPALIPLIKLNKLNAFIPPAQLHANNIFVPFHTNPTVAENTLFLDASSAIGCLMTIEGPKTHLDICATL